MPEEICRNLQIKVQKDVILAQYTTFRIGGPADFFAEPENKEQLRDLTVALNREGLPYFILGRGSNILIRDGGFRGVVISLEGVFKQIDCEDCRVKVGAGVALPSLSVKMAEKELTGLEFAWGIPGTMGGALVMNAGAFGSSMGDLVEEVLVLTKSGEIKTLNKEEISFYYRGSSLKQEGYIILEGTILLKKGERDAIRAKMKSLREERRGKQPAQPSAGSIFRNPTNVAAGKLIEDAGLKGFSLGGALISDVHANFIVNTGSASAADVLGLIDMILNKVNNVFGVDLKLEIQLIGEDKCGFQGGMC